MSSQTLVSVVIPSHNYAAFLPQAVASVLAQRAPGIDVEVIVVDDGSTDNTVEVAQGLGADITFIHQENTGPSGARNAGLRFTLEAPWSLMLMDDPRVIHESTPIQPVEEGVTGHRDTLVLTYRAGGFQDEA